MTKSKRLLKRRRRFAAAFVGIVVCGITVFGLSGVPKLPSSSESANASALRPIQAFGAMLADGAREARSGKLNRALVTPGNKWHRAIIADGVRPNLRRSGARYLGQCGGRGSIGVLLRMVDAKDPSVARAAQVALGDVMARHDSAWSFAKLGTSLRAQDISDLGKARAVTIIKQMDNAAAQDIVLGLMGKSDKLDGAILPALGRLAILPTEADQREDVVSKVRPFLESEKPEMRREAASTLARLGDIESTNALIALLDDGNLGVRGNAHWALKHLTSYTLPPTSSAWRNWMKRENAWWDTHGEELRAALNSDNAATICVAIRTASEHPLHRENVRKILEDLVFHSESSVRRVASYALARLCSRRSTPVLIAALSDINASVRKAAHGALKRLTGEDRGPSPKDWERYR